jgi:hypothetical protein
LWVTGVETVADLGLLLLGEVFDAVPEQPSDFVERVVFVPASSERVLCTRRRTSSTTWLPSRTT